MSRNIWHSASEIPLFDDTVVFIDDLNNWHTGYTQRDNDGITDHDSGEIYTEENLLRWAYIKDFLTLETELGRTRKALEIAVDGIKYMRNNCLEYAADYMDKADEILEQITALEQKD